MTRRLGKGRRPSVGRPRQHLTQLTTLPPVLPRRRRDGHPRSRGSPDYAKSPKASDTAVWASRTSPVDLTLLGQTPPLRSGNPG